MWYTLANGRFYRKRALRMKFMNIQHSKYVKYEIFDKSGIIAILSSHNTEVKHTHTPMSETVH